MTRSAWCGSMLALLLGTWGASPAQAAQGFGATTPGGAGQPVVHVTNLSDSGAGSLRQALLSGNRRVVFDVAGTINLLSVLEVRGSYVTIDGSTAPAPGITIRQAGLRIAYNNGTTPHDVVIQHVRVRAPGINSTEGDGFTIRDGVYNILLDHVSVDGCGDGNIDITKSAHDVTVQWSVLSSCLKNMLVNYGAGRLSLHHNLWAASQWRNPEVQYSDGSATVAPAISADVRNNLVWGWGDSGGGTIVKCGGKANVVNNYYVSNATTLVRKQNAIVNEGCTSGYPGPSFYTRGNVSGDAISLDIDTLGNVSSPYAAATVDTQDACTAAKSVLAGAGAQPRDTLDQQTVGRIGAPTCSSPVTLALTAQPTAVAAGQASTLSWSTTGAVTCTASGGWSGSRAVSGSAIVSSTATTAYTLACSGAGVTVTRSVTVSVVPPPTAALAASPSAITAGQSTTLSWSSTNATSCAASGGWSGARSTSGTQAVAPAATATYTITCSGVGGAASASTAVTVSGALPAVSLSATPDVIGAGQSTTLSWTAVNATSCTASGGWSGTRATSGSASVVPAATTGYTLTCSGGVSTASRSVTVTVVSSLSAAQGWGSSTAGGSGQPSVHVTNLDDSGAGSLREALLLGNRYVVFDVAGSIDLLSVLEVRGSFVTIDGRSAPPPGITLRQSGLRIAYNNGTTPHDVVITGLRIRSPGTYSAEGDGVTIKDGVSNVVLDHLSIDGCRDGNVDVTKGVHDVTVQWSLLSGCAKNMLINYETQRVSLHHNVFAGGSWRNPLIQYSDGSATVAPGPLADVRNNLVWGWGDGGGGTILACGAKANVVSNYYLSGATTLSRKQNAIVNDGCGSGYPGPSFYASGNVSGDGVPVDINAVGNVSTAYAAAGVTTQDACTAAKSALAAAGASPRDVLDQQRVSSIPLVCP